MKKMTIFNNEKKILNEFPSLTLLKNDFFKPINYHT